MKKSKIVTDIHINERRKKQCILTSQVSLVMLLQVSIVTTVSHGIVYVGHNISLLNKASCVI